MICEVSAYRSGRVFPRRITQSNRTRTCLYANFYQARGTTIQGNLFPWLTEELGPLSETHKRLISTLELVRIDAFLRCWPGLPGRPLLDRAALARAFVAKMVMKLPTTSMLIEHLGADKRSRRLCGWERPGQVPSEATFSRAFAEFATSELPTRVHEALIKRTHEDRLVGHISRDATAIEAREKPVQIAAPEMPKRKRGRPRKGEVVEKEARRLERQAAMSLAEMVDDLPKHCAVGTKRNAKGHTTSWIGYKLHLDVADGDIPVSGLLSSASLHDSQAAIPLATLTAGRLTNLYDLMDSAYDAPEIKQHSRSLGHSVLPFAELFTNAPSTVCRSVSLRRQARNGLEKSMEIVGAHPERRGKGCERG